MIEENITKQAKDIVKALSKKGLKIATAESCTGGLLAAYITNIEGSSKVFDRGFVTYSNKSKIDLLTVPTMFIEEFGAVSNETAIAMAEGALLMSDADIAISITGIAGPKSDNSKKPVGTVYIALAKKDLPTTSTLELFEGSRSEIRNQSVEKVFKIINKLLG